MKNRRKLKKITVKLLSLLLTLVLILLSFPLSALAVETTTAEEDTTHTDELLTDIAPDWEYTANDTSAHVTEIESRREENVKHFLLPDGSVEAVAYSYAVHRKDGDGVWQDIDNTILSNNEKTPNFYTTDDMRVVFAKNYQANSHLVTLNENGYSLGMTLLPGTISTTPFDSLDTMDAPIASTVSVTNAPSRSNIREWESVDDALQINNTSSIRYTNVQSNTDLEYVLDGNNIKENIIIKSPKADYAFTFRLDLTGLRASLKEDGSVELLDNITGTVQYVIPAPFMYDAAGETSYDVSYTLKKETNGSYLLTITANPDWINAEDRAFPVVIDPNITYPTTTRDTYISSSNPNLNYGSQSTMWLSSTRIPFIKMATLPHLPAGATVTSGRLRVSFYYNVTSGSLKMGSYQVLQPWNETALTWNSANQYSNLGISTTRMSTATLYAGSASALYPEWGTIYVAAAMQSWYASPSTNYGVALKYESGSNASVILMSYNGPNSFRPYFIIHYTEPKIENGVYKIKNCGSGKYLDVSDGLSTPGTHLQQWSGELDDGNRNQLFKITYLTTVSNSNLYSIRPMVNSGLLLYAPYTATGDRSVTIEEDSLTDSYSALGSECIWQIYENGNSGTYYIENGLTTSESYLCNSENSENGGTIVTAEQSGSSCCTWLVEKYEADEMIGITFRDFASSLVVGETYTYQAVAYSSAVNQNGPPVYVVYSENNTATDIATIDASTGVLTANGVGTVRVGAKFSDLGTYWYWLVTITEPLDGVYFIRNAEYDKYMRLDDNSSGTNSGDFFELHDFDGETEQRFELVYVGTGHYQIKSFSGMCLTAPTSLDAKITQSYYSGTASQQWKIAATDTGVYKISPRSYPSYYMAAGSGLGSGSGRNIEMRETQSDGKDEWILWGHKDYSLMYIGKYVGDPDMLSILSSVQTELQSQGYGGRAYTSLTKSELILELTSSTVFSCITHGTPNSITVSDGEFYSSDFSMISDEALNNLKFVYLGACLTGYGGSDGINMVHNISNKGVDNVLGFKEEIFVIEANLWTEVFMNSLSEGDTIEEAMEKADNAVKADGQCSLLPHFSTEENRRCFVGSLTDTPFD